MQMMNFEDAMNVCVGDIVKNTIGYDCEVIDISYTDDDEYGDGSPTNATLKRVDTGEIKKTSLLLCHKI